MKNNQYNKWIIEVANQEYAGKLSDLIKVAE